MAPRCTYKVGGSAAALIEANSVSDLVSIGRVRVGMAEPMAVAVIGKGSNLLVADEGFDGLVVALGEGLADIEIIGTVVRCGGAALLPVVARHTVSHGLGGFEWAVGVPGSIGGAARMNAGGHGAEMSESMVEVRVVDLDSGQDVTMSVADLALTYRSSAIRPHHVVASVVLELAVADPVEGAARLSEIVRWRREHQPGGANAGSVFENPEGRSAGQLIESAGLKGHRVGGAAISEKHANFIQADPDASTADILDLMAAVRIGVAAKHGTDLRAETKVLGVSDDAAAAAGIHP